MLIKKIKNKNFLIFALFLIIVISLIFLNYITQTINGIKIIYYFNKNRLDLSLFYLNKANEDFFFFINQKQDLLIDKLLIYLLIKDYKDAKNIIDIISLKISLLDKDLQISYFLYKGLYYMALQDNKEALEIFKKVLKLDPDNKNAKIYIETLFKIKNNSNLNSTNKNDNDAEKKIKNLIIEKIINSSEIKGFQNYKNYINKKNRNEDKNYW